MRIFVITFGDSKAGSTQYRFMQYLPLFQKEGFHIDFVHHLDINEEHLEAIAVADLVINQKSLLPSNLTKKITRFSRRLVFDFDDAIYTRQGKPYSWITQWRVTSRLKSWLRHSHTVFTANHYLKCFAQKYSSNVHVIPMALDLNTWKAKKNHQAPFPMEELTIGWAGAPANLHHLEKMDSLLVPFLAKNCKLKLIVYSGKQPKLLCRHEYFPFKAGEEFSFIQQLDIGLLPLSEEEFSRGKSPIKAIQYLACEVPVVGNVFGATSEILNPTNSIAVNTQQEWIEALNALLYNPELRYRFGKNGRQHIEKHHDMKINGQLLIDLIKNLLR